MLQRGVLCGASAFPPERHVVPRSFSPRRHEWVSIHNSSHGSCVRHSAGRWVQLSHMTCPSSGSMGTTWTPLSCVCVFVLSVYFSLCLFSSHFQSNPSFSSPVHTSHLRCVREVRVALSSAVLRAHKLWKCPCFAEVKHRTRVHQSCFESVLAHSANVRGRRSIFPTPSRLAVSQSDS